MAVYSSLSLKNSRAGSDIDMFFVTQADRAWSARFWLNLFLKIFRLRPTSISSKDKLCASYIVDENHLDLSGVNYKSDYFYAYGCAEFVFLSADKELERKFWTANNWIKEFLPAWQTNSMRRKRSNKWLKRMQSFKEKILGIVPEKYYRDFQMKILPQKYLDNNDGKKVLLSGGTIKLHDNDKRGEYDRLFDLNFKHATEYEKSI
jgi:hypothetical protein